MTLSFRNVCPFTVMRLQNLPNPQRYTRQERYRAQPPRVLEPSGFHTENSLALYQGLVYYLLWLHSKYDKVGGWGAVPGRAWSEIGLRRHGRQGPRGWRNDCGGWPSGGASMSLGSGAGGLSRALGDGFAGVASGLKAGRPGVWVRGWD